MLCEDCTNKSNCKARKQDHCTDYMPIGDIPLRCCRCGEAYRPLYTGMIKRDVFKCGCGNLRYVLSVGTKSKGYASFEFEPSTKWDKLFLDVVFGVKRKGLK